jgi:dTDP-4-amino-4,6-dideoxygalactose transaminase
MNTNIESVPFVNLNLQNTEVKEEVLSGISSIVNTSRFILGKHVEEFEESFAAYCGTKYAVGVGSGTEALTIAIRALDLKQGSEILVPANTFVATIEAIIHGGGIPVLVDIDPETYNLDTTLIEKSITAKTKAIIPVHLYGQPVDMNPLIQIARKFELAIIEDAAQAHGALYDGKRAGSIGDMGCFSFYPSKNLGAWGDGGAITTSDPNTYEILRQLRDHGSAGKSNHVKIGYTSRLDSLQALVLNTKLPHLEKWNEMRRDAASYYNSLLEEFADHIILPLTATESDHVYHLYVVRLKNLNRSDFQSALKNAGIMTGIHYPKPVHKTPAFDYLDSKFPISESSAENILSLPMYPGITKSEIEYIAKCITSYLKKNN